MRIPVVLIDGTEESVSRAELQKLLASQQIMFFQRSGGWVVIGREQDSLRCQNLPFQGDERRQAIEPAKGSWH